MARKTVGWGLIGARGWSDNVLAPALTAARGATLRGVLSSLFIFLLIISLLVMTTEILYEVGHHLRMPLDDFVLAGHRVRMWPGARQKHAELFRSGAILLEGLGRTGEARLELVSDDPGEVVRRAEVIVCTDPAPSQAKRALILAPHLENGQVVFLSPGSLGPLVFEKALRANGRRIDLSYAEPGTLPYLTRKVEPTKVQVNGLAALLPMGVFPACNTDQTFERVSRLYSAAHPVENALSVALLNVGQATIISLGLTAVMALTAKGIIDGAMKDSDGNAYLSYFFQPKGN